MATVEGRVGTGSGAAVSPEMKIGITIGTVFIPLLGIILGAMYMKDAHPEKKSTGRLWLYTGIGVVAFYCFLTVLAGLSGL